MFSPKSEGKSTVCPWGYDLNCIFAIAFCYGAKIQKSLTRRSPDSPKSGLFMHKKEGA
jgi:hypothetical protein